MADPVLGFPDLFTTTLLNQLVTAFAPGDLGVVTPFTRPLRPKDPTRSISVFEGDCQPIEYEIGQPGISELGNANPSLMRWNVGAQVLVKAGEEQDGRASRAKLLNRVRSTLFSNVSMNAIMPLRDGITQERITKYRLRRIAYASGDLAEEKAKFFIGQVELYFDTQT